MIRRSRPLRLPLLFLFFGSGASIGSAMTPVRQSYSPLRMARDEYTTLLCFATAARTSAARAERAGDCAAVPALTPEGALHVIEKACKPKGCPQVDRSVPAILFLGLGGRSTHVLVAPTRSGIAFDPRGTQLPRTTGLIAVSVTDYSEGLSTSMEISTTERGRAIRSDASTEPDPARPQGFPEQDRDVAVTMASFDLPHTPSAVSLQYVETDVRRLRGAADRSRGDTIGRTNLRSGPDRWRYASVSTRHRCSPR